MDQNKPKLYWLHSHFLYWMGGTKYVFEVLRRLTKEYEVTVIVENSSDYASQIYTDAGIKLISLGKLSSTSLFYWLTFPYQVINTYFGVRKHILDDRSKVIVSMFPMNLVGTLLQRPYYQLCFEPFAFFHDPDFIAGFSTTKRNFIKLLKLLYSWLDVFASRHAIKIITLNQVTQASIKDTYDRSSIPVYTGIDSKHFYPHFSKQLANQYVGDELIIHSTDYTPVKGTDKMISIFARVKSSRPKAKLLITSTIKNQEAVRVLQEQARVLGVLQSIEFLGFVDYDLLPQLYSLSRVLVQCSFSEKSGTTSMALPVKEALSCGTWCIRSPITTEDVIDGKTGYLVDPRDEELMVDRIIQVLSMNKSEYDKGSKIARSTIIKSYTWEQTVKRISSIIK